ncbi:MAG: phosphoribosylglycinamide formyltransferase [Kineosporiaceae bacterium]
MAPAATRIGSALVAEHRGRERVVVLVSGEGTLLQALLDAARDPDSPFRVAGVVSDRREARGIERARAGGVPTAVVAPGDFPDRRAWDAGVTRAVGVFRPRLVVLAGFMRLLGDAYLAEFGDRTINTHPALLPSFPGAHGVRDALAHGVKVTGASVILVDEGTDTGPIVAQRPVAVLEGDDEPSLHERIKVVERELLVDVVCRMTAHGWQVFDRKVRLG